MARHRSRRQRKNPQLRTTMKRLLPNTASTMVGNLLKLSPVVSQHGGLRTPSTSSTLPRWPHSTVGSGPLPQHLLWSTVARPGARRSNDHPMHPPWLLHGVETTTRSHTGTTISSVMANQPPRRASHPRTLHWAEIMATSHGPQRTWDSP